MLRLVKPVAKWTGKKSMWAGLFAFVAWTGIEMYDGAHDRLVSRYTQAKEVVVPPAEQGYEKITAIAEKLWVSLENNPGPTIMALSLFVITIVYHKMHGKGLKEALASTILRTQTTTSEPQKPKIILKAEQELLYEKLISSETVLVTKIENLPGKINTAYGKMQSAEYEAKRAQEEATRKAKVAKDNRDEYEKLTRELETAKSDLTQLREQLGVEQTD